MTLAACAAGVYHAYASAEFDLFVLSPLAVWTALTALTVLIGLAAGIWVVFFYRRRQFRHEGVITGVNRLSSDITEIDITLATQMKYSKGQYAFVRIFQDGLEDAPHPFTISGGDGRDIRLTIKASGDFTKDLYAMVKPGTRAALSEPLGRMDFAHGGQHQLWIAGGIGITPFIAYLEGVSLLRWMPPHTHPASAPGRGGSHSRGRLMDFIRPVRIEALENRERVGTRAWSGRNSGSSSPGRVVTTGGGDEPWQQSSTCARDRPSMLSKRR